MAEATSVPTTSMPLDSSRVTNQDHPTASYILEKYPITWQGKLVLENSYALVQMHFISGNSSIAKESLSPIVNCEGEPPLNISRRLRMDPEKLENVSKKMQVTDKHCILLTLPCGKDFNDIVIQVDKLQYGILSYLFEKHAAGIISDDKPLAEKPPFTIHVFPPCDFVVHKLARICPDLLVLVNEIPHLVTVITTD